MNVYKTVYRFILIYGCEMKFVRKVRDVTLR